MQRLVAPDVVATFDGRTRFAGRYHGVPEVVALVATVQRSLVPRTSELQAVDGAGVTVHSTVRVVFRDVGGRFRPATLHHHFEFDGRGMAMSGTLELEDDAVIARWLDRLEPGDR